MSKTCNNCNADGVVIPYVVHEAEMARAERNAFRLWVVIIVCIALLFVSNAFWLWAWTSYDYISEETVIEQDAGNGGNANYIGNNGDITNGISKDNNPQTNTP